MTRRHAFTRRSLLKAMGVGPALLPMLEAERALAACAGVSGPKRTFIIVWPNGMIAKTGGSWATTGANFTLPTAMKSLETHRNELILMDGLDYKFVKDSPNPSGGEVSGHACFQGMLTGKWYQSFGSGTASNVAGALSIDQHIGKNLKSKGYTGLVSLNTQVYSRSTARLSWKAAGDPIIPDADPYHVFSTLFSGQATMPVTTTGTGGSSGGGTTTTVDKNLLMRQSILDYVAKDLTRFVKTVGGAEDMRRVDSHLQSVRDLEQQVKQQIDGASTGAGGSGGGTTTPPPAATACKAPDLGTKVDVKSTKNWEALTKMQIDMAVAAFAADATRVVVLQLGDQGNPDVILFSLGFTEGGQDGNTGNVNAHHSIAHRNSTEKTKIDTWFFEQFAYAIARLKDVTDGGGSLLDNTALLGMNNMRTGIHEYVNVPALLAGSCGGYFKTGRSLKLTNTPNNGVLIALANAMGVPTETFGETMYGGELTALKG